MMGRPNLVFLKLGGSLITDKSVACTARHDVIARLARETRQALDAAPDLRLLLGHGSGSFGHWAAQPYGTRRGVHTADQWRGYAEVAAAAARLNRIVTDAFLEAGVQVLSLQPSASARCRGGALTYLDTRPVHAALNHDLVPLVYGDVALDETQGGTIVSTEDLFLFLAQELEPARILLLGQVEGVLDPQGDAIPRISPADLPTLRDTFAEADGVDVTGGMADKVARMTRLVERYPRVRAQILSGTRAGLLTRVLCDPAVRAGTWVVSG